MEKPAITLDMQGPLHNIVIDLCTGKFKKQGISPLMDLHWILTKLSLTSIDSANKMSGMSSMFDIFCPQLIFVHS